jgi:hypothetical protein
MPSTVQFLFHHSGLKAGDTFSFLWKNVIPVDADGSRTTLRLDAFPFPPLSGQTAYDFTVAVEVTHFSRQTRVNTDNLGQDHIRHDISAEVKNVGTYWPVEVDLLLVITKN